jgi:hypothetical protein
MELLVFKRLSNFYSVNMSVTCIIYIKSYVQRTDNKHGQGTANVLISQAVGIIIITRGVATSQQKLRLLPEKNPVPEMLG